MKILKNKNGQGTLEYIMISALIGVACLTAFKSFGKKLETKMQQIERKVMTTLDMRNI